MSKPFEVVSLQDRHPDRFGRDKGGGGGDTGGGNPPGGGELEGRVSRLESDIEYIKRDVSELKGDVKTLVSGMSAAQINIGKTDVRLSNIESHMVTKGQLAMYTLLAVLSTLGVILGAGWWAIQQYLIPVLRGTGHA